MNEERKDGEKRMKKKMQWIIYDRFNQFPH